MTSPNQYKASKIRFFTAVFFEKEEDLIAALNMIEKKIGKYDYISSYITCTGTELIPTARYAEAKAKLISFPGLTDMRKFPMFAAKVYKKKESLLKNKINVQMIPGFLNSHQVAAAYEEFRNHRIEVYQGIFVQVELKVEHSKLEPLSITSFEFKLKNFISYLNDARRLFLSAINK